MHLNAHFARKPLPHIITTPDMRSPFLPLLTALLALASCTSAAKQSKNPKNAILLSKVKSLTLRGDAKTAHRRVPPIPQ